MTEKINIILSGQIEDSTRSCIDSYPKDLTEETSVPESVGAFAQYGDSGQVYMIWSRDEKNYIGVIYNNIDFGDSDGFKLLTVIVKDEAYIDGENAVKLLSSLLASDGKRLVSVSDCEQIIKNAGVIPDGAFRLPLEKKITGKYAFRVYHDETELYDYLSFYNQEEYGGYDYILFVPAKPATDGKGIEEYISDAGHTLLTGDIKRRYKIEIREDTSVKSKRKVWNKGERLVLSCDGYDDFVLESSDVFNHECVQPNGLRLIVYGSKVPFKRRCTVKVRGVDEYDREQIKINVKIDNKHIIEIKGAEGEFELTRQQCEEERIDIFVSVSVEGYKDEKHPFSPGELDGSISIQMKKVPQKVQGHFRLYNETSFYSVVKTSSEAEPITSLWDMNCRVMKRWLEKHSYILSNILLVSLFVVPLSLLVLLLAPDLPSIVSDKVCGMFTTTTKPQADGENGSETASVLQPTDSVYAYLKSNDIWSRDTLTRYSMSYDSCLENGNIALFKELYLAPRPDSLSNAKARELVDIYMNQKIADKDKMDSIIKSQISDSTVKLSAMLSELQDFVKTRKKDNGKAD